MYHNNGVNIENSSSQFYHSNKMSPHVSENGNVMTCDPQLVTTVRVWTTIVFPNINIIVSTYVV